MQIRKIDWPQTTNECTSLLLSIDEQKKHLDIEMSKIQLRYAENDRMRRVVTEIFHYYETLKELIK